MFIRQDYDIIRSSNRENHATLRWIQDKDNIGSFDYAIPRFKTRSFKIFSKKKSQRRTFVDKIQNLIKINGDNDIHHTEEEIEISKNNETETILEFFLRSKKMLQT